MKRTMLVLLVAVLAAAPMRAHEGHVHKVMGVVAVRHDSHLEVKATNGKTATLTLNEKTKVFRGKTVLKLSDIRTGDRVVVTATETKGKDGKTSLIASRIQLGTVSASGAKE
jgi:hypothetical protein